MMEVKDGPRVVPDPTSSGPSVVAVFWGMISLGLLGACQGTLAWAAFRIAHGQGWLDRTPDLFALIGIATAFAFARAFDRSVFRRQ